MNPLFVAVVTAVLGTAAVLATIRIVRGPSVLDRAVGADVLVSILVISLGVEAAANRHSTTLPILVSLSLVGFVGSVAVARFAARDADPRAGTTRVDPQTGLVTVDRGDPSGSGDDDASPQVP